jgi:hypothetical protein
MNANGQMIASSFWDTHDGDNDKSSSGQSHLFDSWETRALGETQLELSSFFLSATAKNNITNETVLHLQIFFSFTAQWLYTGALLVRWTCNVTACCLFVKNLLFIFCTEQQRKYSFYKKTGCSKGKNYRSLRSQTDTQRSELSDPPQFSLYTIFKVVICTFPLT